MDDSSRIARIAGALAEPTRVRILLLLMKGEATTMDISARLGVLQPRISSHLSILLKYALVSVGERGRQRIYSVDFSTMGPLLSNLSTLAVHPRRRAPLSLVASELRESNEALRRCRTCYDHLAGVAGVELLDKMVQAGWLYKTRESGKGYDLTQLGATSLAERGLDIERAKRANRIFAYACMDWTERRPHLGGSLGSATLSSLLASGFAERMKGTRALRLLRPISTWTRL